MLAVCQAAKWPGEALVLSRLRQHGRLVVACLTLPVLIFSWFAPIFTLTQLWVLEDRITLVSVLTQLLEAGNLLLAVVIGLTTLVLPLSKVVLLIMIQWPNSGRILSPSWVKLFEKAGRWAMLDIWVVALSVVAIKLSAWLDAEIEYGLYLQLGLVIAISWQSTVFKLRSTG